MRSKRVTVAAGATAELTFTGESGGYGSQLLAYNVGPGDLELGGADISGANSWRGFTAGATVGVELDQNEKLMVRNPNAAAGNVDVLDMK